MKINEISRREAKRVVWVLKQSRIKNGEASKRNRVEKAKIKLLWNALRLSFVVSFERRMRVEKKFDDDKHFSTHKMRPLV